MLCAGAVEPVLARIAYDRTHIFFVVADALRADGTRENFWWFIVALNISGKCNEERYECLNAGASYLHSEKICTVEH